MTTQFMDAAQVAERLQQVGLKHLTERWVRRQLDQRLIPFVMVGRRRMVSAEVVEAIIKALHDTAILRTSSRPLSLFRGS